MSRFRQTYLIIYLLLIFPALRAEVFMVVNVNESGTGSLRDAILRANANGTAEMDFIYFDIPARARDKTIYIRPTNLLPALTSNITIDGTSQSGDPLGVSSAKTAITIEGAFAGSTPIICFDLTSASNVSIYGIKMTSAVIDRSTGQPPSKLYAIYLKESAQIAIGSAGKGNVIVGWNKGIFNESAGGRFGLSGRITVIGNYFGIDSDGLTIVIGGRTGSGPAGNDYGVHIERALGPVRIGGDLDEETNYFNSFTTDVAVEGEYNSNTDRGTAIINNRFGIGYRNSNLNSSTTEAIRLSNMSTWAAGFPPITISKNQIGGTTRQTGIHVFNILARFVVSQNTIGYEENNQPPRNSNYSVGIFIHNCENAVIGGTTATLANIIRYQQTAAIVCDTTRDISIFQNSTYCNSQRAITLEHWEVLNPAAREKPFVTINRIDDLFGLVSGKSPRLSTIELFTDDECVGCEGKTFIARTNSDANGNWTYRGPLPGANIIATASDQGNATSEYSKPEIDTSALISPAVICNGQLASICGLKIKSGTRWQWEDAAGNMLGTDTCLNNVGLGTYYLRVAIGTNSCEERFRFVVRDSVINIDSSARITISHNRCGKSNGSIRGFLPVNANRWQWEDGLGNIVSTQVELNNVPAGRYRFRVFNRLCDLVTSYYEIADVSPLIQAANPQITASTCSRNNGSITGITATGTNYSTIQWKDENGQVVANGLNLTNVPAGRYKLVITDASEGCGDSTNYFTIPATSAPILNTLAATVINSTCGQPNGAVTGITSANTIAPVVYVWVNAQNLVVGNSLSLTNVPAGSYLLKMKDAGACDTVYSSVFVIQNNGSVAMDTTAVTIRATGCTRINGSITGMRITGATSIRWVNTVTNVVVGTDADLVNVGAGTYRLEITNSTYNCSTSSNVYSITQAAPVSISVTQSSAKDASCNTNNGTIDITAFDNNRNLFSFEWLRDSTLSIGNNLSIQNLAPATYYLIATDTNGCRRSVYKRTIVMLAMPTLNETNVQLQHDTCTFKSGAINGITASSDAGNLNYQWYSNGSIPVGSSRTLTGVSAGSYHLVVTDLNGCQVRSADYTIQSVVASLAAPVYDDITIPRYANTTLRIRNARAAVSYELTNLTTGQQVQSNSTGIFNLVNVQEDTRYSIQAVAGPCSSAAGTVWVKVVDMTKIDVPNAFSPNADGINDLFKIRVTGYFLSEGLKIFNRWGQLVYETRDLNQEWDGRFKGNPLPVATYYWVLEGIDVEGKRLKRSGSVTLIR